MKPLTNDHYSYRAIWSEEDNEYVGLCAEFPSLSWLASSPEKAIHGIREAVAAVIDDMRKNGEAVPAPVISKQYSGKFIVRVPPEVHRRLALEAAEAGVSLNRLASARLSHWGVWTFRNANRSPEEDACDAQSSRSPWPRHRSCH